MANDKKSAPIIELLVIIMNKDKSEKIIKLLNNLRVDLQLLSRGSGTADSSMADYFALDLSEKDVIFALIKLKDADNILSIIDEKLKFNNKNTGLALTIPIKSASYSLIEQMGFTF